jgi:hypothetical protein
MPNFAEAGEQGPATGWEHSGLDIDAELTLRWSSSRDSSTRRLTSCDGGRPWSPPRMLRPSRSALRWSPALIRGSPVSQAVATPAAPRARGRAGARR